LVSGRLYGREKLSLQITGKLAADFCHERQGGIRVSAFSRLRVLNEAVSVRNAKLSWSEARIVRAVLKSHPGDRFSVARPSFTDTNVRHTRSLPRLRREWNAQLQAAVDEVAAELLDRTRLV
jgi:hypothetical protein